MEAGVAAALLAASFLHAAWHALVKSSGDRVVALAGMNLVSGAVAIACLPFARLPSAGATLVIAASVLLHGSYKVALARLYAHADLSRAYPLGRGVTPIIAALLGIAFLGQVPGALSFCGIVLVSVGVAGLAFEGKATASLAVLGIALLVGGTVACYSVLDAYGIALNGDWLGFTAWLIACDSVAFVAYALATRKGAALAGWRRDRGRVLASGTLGVASFGIFMWALGRAPVGAVSALRETSILFAAALGALALKERMTPLRYLSATAVMLGIAAISAFR